jgi:hypothetical protein
MLLLQVQPYHWLLPVVAEGAEPLQEPPLMLRHMVQRLLQVNPLRVVDLAEPAVEVVQPVLQLQVALLLPRVVIRLQTFGPVVVAVFIQMAVPAIQVLHQVADLISIYV